MTEKTKIYGGLAIVLVLIGIIGFITVPLIENMGMQNVPLAMLFAILLMAGMGLLLAFFWRGVPLKNHGKSRWLILLLVAAFYAIIYHIPTLWFLSIAPLIMPFLGFWFARRFFNW